MAAPFLGLVIILAELTITALGLFYPRVDKYYRDYFITHHASCLLSNDLMRQVDAVLLNKQIDFGKLDANSACFVLRGGWGVPDAGGVWSEARTASFELPVAGHNLTLKLQAMAFAGPRQIKVFVDGRLYETVLLPNNVPENLRLDMPADQGDIVMISFQIARPQGTKDDHPLPSIGLIAAVWN